MSAEKTGDLYHNLRKLWKDAHPYEAKQTAEKNMLQWWNENKTNRVVVLQQIQRLTLKIKGRGNPILSSFSKSSSSNSKGTLQPSNEPVEKSVQEPVNESETMTQVSSDEDDGQSSGAASRSIHAPAQLRVKESLIQINSELLTLSNARNAGLSLSTDQANRLKILKTDKEALTKKLKRLQSLQSSSRKHRNKVKETVERLRESNPDAAKELHAVLPQTVGKPRLEKDQPGLMETILNIVTHHSNADERRRTESLRSIKTLDALLKELKMLGHNISRSGLYVRLLPRNCSTNEGKRHVNTVAVKLVRPENNLRKSHPDTHFAAATVKYLKNLATLFGEEAACIISQDGKARIPLGVTAANKQGPILMKMDYRVQLPDHDFVVASKHKLIPSVYAGLKIENDAVSYSGPTYIALRSGKHDKSTAPRHADDLYRLMQLEDFKKFTQTSQRQEQSDKSSTFKPIMIYW